MKEEAPSTCIPCLELASMQMTDWAAFRQSYSTTLCLLTSQNLCLWPHPLCIQVFLDGWKAYVLGPPRPSQCGYTEGKVILSHLLSTWSHWPQGYLFISNLRERFWWPMLDEDVKWFGSTCHPFQIQQTHHLHLPPTVPDIPMLSARFTLIPCSLSISFAIFSRPIVPCPLGLSGTIFRRKMRRLLENLYSRISCADGVEWLKLLLTMAPHF